MRGDVEAEEERRHKEGERKTEGGTGQLRLRLMQKVRDGNILECIQMHSHRHTLKGICNNIWMSNANVHTQTPKNTISDSSNKHQSQKSILLCPLLLSFLSSHLVQNLRARRKPSSFLIT